MKQIPKQKRRPANPLAHGGGLAGQLDDGHFVGRQGTPPKAPLFAWMSPGGVTSGGVSFPMFEMFVINATQANVPQYIRPGPSLANRQVDLFVGKLPPSFNPSGPGHFDAATIPADRDNFYTAVDNRYAGAPPNGEGIPGVNCKANFAKVVLMDRNQPAPANSELAVAVVPGARLAEVGLYSVCEIQSDGTETPPVAWHWRPAAPLFREVWLFTQQDSTGKPWFHKPGPTTSSTTWRFKYLSANPPGLTNTSFQTDENAAVQAFRDYVFNAFPNAQDTTNPSAIVPRILDEANLKSWRSLT